MNGALGAFLFSFILFFFCTTHPTSNFSNLPYMVELQCKNCTQFWKWYQPNPHTNTHLSQFILHCWVALKVFLDATPTQPTHPHPPLTTYLAWLRCTAITGQYFEWDTSLFPTPTHTPTPNYTQLTLHKVNCNNWTFFFFIWEASPYHTSTPHDLPLMAEAQRAITGDYFGCDTTPCYIPTPNPTQL